MVTPNPTGFSFGKTTNTGFPLGSSIIGNSAVRTTTPSTSFLPTSTHVPLNTQGASGFGISPQLNPSSATSTFTSPAIPFGSLGGFLNPTNSLITPTPTNLTGSTAQLGFGQVTATPNLFKPPLSNNSKLFSSPVSSSSTLSAKMNSFQSTVANNSVSIAPHPLVNTNTTVAPITTSSFGLSQSTLGTNIGFKPTSTAPTPFGQLTSIPSSDKVEVSEVSKSNIASAFGLTNTSSLATLSSSFLSPTLTPNLLLTPTPKTSTNVSLTSTIKPLTYNQLEELINKWTYELDEQERYFLDEADRINHWDQALISNAENITALYEKMETCQGEQIKLGQELDFIEGQQRELENLLEPLERAANELPPGQLHSDYEREAIFQLATNVDLELGQLLTDLREMAAQTNVSSMNLNDTSAVVLRNDPLQSKKGLTTEGADVMQQITRILNYHMHSLNWIHHNTREFKCVRKYFIQ